MELIFWLGFALAASPGPDFFLMVKHTMSGGRRIGYVTLAGNRLSLICHITFAVFGLSMILQESAWLFTFVRILGAAYLIYLGCKNLASKLNSTKKTASNPALAPVQISALQAFRDGFFNNLLNPKVSLFFLSIFPQFTTGEQLSASPVQVAFAIFLGNCCWYVPILFIIGTSVIRKAVQQIQQVLDVIFGAIFMGYGFTIVWSEFRKMRMLNLG